MRKTKQNKNSHAERMRDIANRALEDAKGADIRVLDVRKLTDITDYMLISSGTSERHVKTQAERVLEYMRDAGWKHIGMEGEDSSEWVLVDFVEVIVHIMRPHTREFYDLESLWDETLGDMLAASNK